MSSYDYDDYDYDAPDDTNITAQYDDITGEFTFPAGSGAGEFTFGAYADEEIFEDHDREVDQEDEEYLAEEQTYYTQQGTECYMVLDKATAYSVGASGTGSSHHVQHYNLHGYSFTCKIPPKFDGNDLQN